MVEIVKYICGTVGSHSVCTLVCIMYAVHFPRTSLVLVSSKYISVIGKYPPENVSRKTGFPRKSYPTRLDIATVHPMYPYCTVQFLSNTSQMYNFKQSKLW